MLHFLAGVLPFLLIISIIVTFHEYGHYSVARLFNTRIERFSLGFGKILLRVRDKRGVDWCLSALPLGGYVKFAGDENIASMMPSADELEAAKASITAREGADAVKDYFHFKPIWQRFLIILAGPAFNFILAIAVFTALTIAVGVSYVPADVDHAMPNSPAAAAGFRHGDHITTVDGHTVGSVDDIRQIISLRSDTQVPVVVVRDGKTTTLQVTPIRKAFDSGDGNKAVQMGYIGIYFQAKVVSKAVDPLTAVTVGVQKTWGTLDQTFSYISRIFTGKESGNQISSILGMTKVTGDVTVDVAKTQATLGQKIQALIMVYVEMIAVISIGVGFLNLLPVPALDGGHLAFYLYQSVSGKPVSAGIQNAAFRVAVVLILGLMLFAGWNDINNYFGGPR